MPKLAEFEQYINQLCEVLGHQDRHAGFADYSRELMLPIERKSCGTLAANTDPLHVSSKHQSLHHLVAMSEWSDTAVLKRVRDWVMARLGHKSKFYWIVDDTGFPKKGEHSVGVARQYCGQLGKQDNCQVAVSLSLATEQGSVPIDWRLKKKLHSIKNAFPTRRLHTSREPNAPNVTCPIPSPHCATFWRGRSSDNSLDVPAATW